VRRGESTRAVIDALGPEKRSRGPTRRVAVDPGEDILVRPGHDVDGFEARLFFA
jgi:hypothetical protein